MAIWINVGEKFSCFAFSNFSLGTGLPEDFRLDAELWASRALPVAVEGHWREWLGSLTIEAILRTNFLLIATCPSRRPEVLDAENQQLTQRVDYVFHGLLVQGVPHYDQGFSLTGANVGGEIEIRQFSELVRYTPSFGTDPLRIDLAELKWATCLADRLRTVNAGGPDWSRLRRGLSALFRGSKEREGGERLHQFVRALEALVKPGIGKTRRQFVHRLQTVAIASRQTLREIFDIRSCVEHLHSPLDALQGSEEQKADVAARRMRQADRLCRFAFSRVLASNDLFKRFRTDAGIDGFWAMPHRERADLWGSRLDLNAIQ